MRDFFFALCGAIVFVGAIIYGFVVVSYEFGIAFGASRGEYYSRRVFGTLLRIDGSDFRYYLSALFDVYHIAYMEVEPLDIVGIV